MTYSSGNPGYQPAQSSTSYGASGSSAPSFAKSDDRESKLQLYLMIAVVVLGLLAYFLSFGSVYNVNSDLGSSSSSPGHGAGVAMAALLAALLAGVGLLPKARNYTAVVAVIAVLGALLLIARTVTLSDNVSAGWALWVILGLAVVQAICSVGALLLDAGVLTAPAPRPKYDQYSQYGGPYGQYGGYYGQPGQQPYQQGPPQSGQQPGYGSQYGGYSSGPSTGGFSAAGGQQHGSHQAQPQGTTTPPTGFPSFSPPPSFGSNQETQVSGQPNSGNHAGSGQQSHSGAQPQSPSGPSQS